jgi:transcriptional regulator with XRE-family HTH domain
MKNLKERIRELLTDKEMTFEQLAEKLGENSRAMHNRLGRNDSIKYSEVEKILDFLGYEIVWRKKKNPPTE